ncbi:MAG: Kae1-associated kinase Bud32 [Archaeoglobaceae archaeon]|nr:Kae1-associated kinase Bud32 [Archaeoglobaceae archaeon]MCX8151988.1 Kae1-associated kinase Bud32 [Archaeoglobaceae archaeon]MDW8013377.1 Kae1-associated kinase Bud32 [Archaeoglobaceae archaeon]
MIYLGGEAEVRILDEVVIKRRISKRYRIKELDEEIRFKRTRTEAKIISAARKVGVATPIILDVEGDTIVMERIKGPTAKDCMNKDLCREIGKSLAKMHSANIIHGDVTPANIIVSKGKIYFVDFGLAYFDSDVEAKGVDLHVFIESLKALYDDWEELRNSFLDGYLEFGSREVVERVKEIELRGRYVRR